MTTNNMNDKAAYITIGQYIMSLGNIQANENYLTLSEEIGYKFASALCDTNTLRTIAKKCIAKHLDYEILMFLTKHEYAYTVTKTIEMSTENCFYTMKLVKGTQHGQFASYIIDFSSVCNNFVILDNLISFHPNSTKAAIEHACVFGLPILIQAGYLLSGEYELQSESKEFFDILDKLTNHYEKLGFINVNEFFGYEESRILYYPNGTLIDFKNI